MQSLVSSYENRGRQGNCGGRGCSDVATNQGMPAATSSWKRQKVASPPDPLEGVWPCQRLGLGSVIFSVVWPPVRE